MLLNENKSQLDITLHTLPLAVIVINREGKICYFNEHCQELIKNIHINEYWNTVLEKNFKPHLAGDLIMNNEGRHLSIKTQPHDSNEGQIIILVDETDIKQNYEQKLHNKIKSLGMLSAMLAHQLKTPLSAAYLYVSNLKHIKDDPKKIINIQERLQKQLNSIKNLIDEVLLLHKSDELVEKIQPVIWLEEVIKNYQELHPERKFLVLKNCMDLSCHIVGNKAALTGMLSNLIDNALQASQKEIEIVIESEYTDLLIHIKDFGEGITEEDIAKVFKPFYTTKSQGTGLGLTIANSVAQAHGGSIEIKSIQHEYTEFIVKLPVNYV